MPKEQLQEHARRVAEHVTDTNARQAFFTLPCVVIDGTGIEIYKPGNHRQGKLLFCWFKKETQVRFQLVCTTLGYTLHMTELDIGHCSDDKATDRSNVAKSFDKFYSFAPDEKAEAARLASKRVGDGGTDLCKCIILGDQGYPDMIVWPGCDIMVTRSAEDAESWARAKDKPYVRVSSGVSSVRSVIERIFGRLAQDCPFITGPVFESQGPLVYKFIQIHTARYNRMIALGQNLFVAE